MSKPSRRISAAQAFGLGIFALWRKTALPTDMSTPCGARCYQGISIGFVPGTHA